MTAADIAHDVIAAIGNTPLIRLKRASERTGCEILGKAEFMNPGQSVKDRAALFIIRDAMEKGLVRTGGTVVEGTAGNTGIGLTVVGNALGLKSVIVIPDTQSQEKKDALRILGAQLIEVPAVPYKDPNNYVKLSGRLAEQIARESNAGAVWANQFDNTANRRAHIETTGPEIWRQTQGKVDGFVCAVGTGGTLAGVGMALKARNPNIVIAIADPMGAALYSWFKTGEVKATGSSITEGIGQSRVTGNLQDAPIDDAFQITDEEMLPVVYDLLEHEGLCLGGSSGINVMGAIRLAEKLGPGHTIVTILADFGTRYQSKIFNPEFLRAKNLPLPHWLSELGTAAAIAVRAMTAPLVSTDWLARHLTDPDLVVVDASWYMAALKRDPIAEFAAAHIPGAQFFNIDALSDHTTDLPHMMPTPADFARGVAALGIGNDSLVVVYDAAGIYSAPRAWWMLRAMGHDRVTVLDGGLPKWTRENRPVESGPARPARSVHFTPRPKPELLRDFNAVLANVGTRREQLLDARSPGRFSGDEKEPRPGLRSGHIPGSRNVYYADLIAPDGTLKPRDELARVFTARAVDLAQPAVTSCGSGVTASIVLLALEVAGAKNTALYDGSWSEWGSRPDSPIEIGAPVATGPA